MAGGASSPRAHLDAGGNARPHARARQAFEQALADGWADPRRLSSESRRASALLGAARESIAHSLGARTEEILLGPSHTAVLHAAVRAAVRGRRRVGGTVVTSAVERSAVLEAARFATAPGRALPADRACEHVRICVDGTGRVDLDAFTDALAAPGVALAALQHSNGEVGTLQPIEDVHGSARAARVPLLVDAGAAVGHARVPSTWDLLAADPADWGGLAGIGVLAVRASVRWAADWPEDADAWFPGGVSVPAAFAAAAALEATLEDRDAQDARRRGLIDLVRARVADIPDVEVVGDPVARLPHVVTFSCLYADGEALVTALDRAGFAVGSGSACASSTLEPSHVLAAMGVLTHGNLRLALDRTTSASEVTAFLDVLPHVVADVRAMLGAQSL